MGRWAQRTRAGGGQPPIPLLYITSLDYTNGDGFVIAHYNGIVTDTDFDPATFSTTPSNYVSIGVSQFAPDALEISFAVDLTAEADLVYDGSVVNVITPQTVPIPH